METGKTSNYIKYAIGEIVLVVIGILIALSINNWNEHRKENIKENIVVKSLYKEFIENSKYLDERIQYLNDGYKNGGVKLLKFCNDNHTEVSPDSLLTLIELAFIGPAYSPKVSTFTRIINNEEFNLIQSDSLKTLLNQYSTILNFTYISSKLFLDGDVVLQSYRNDKFGGLAFGKKIREYQLSEYHIFDEIEAKEPAFDPNDIVSDPVFESILVTHELNYGFALNRLLQLQDLNKTIREYIDTYYSIE